MDLKGSQVRSFQRAGNAVKPLWIASQSRESYGWILHSKDGTGFNGTFFRGESCAHVVQSTLAWNPSKDDMFFIYLDAEEPCVSCAREKTDVWEILQSSLLAPGSRTHVCYGPPPRPGHGQPGHSWASTSKYIRSWWCQSLSDVFWTVFWNTSQPYTLFFIFHSLDLLPVFEVEFSNVSAQPPSPCDHQIHRSSSSTTKGAMGNAESFLGGFLGGAVGLAGGALAFGASAVTAISTLIATGFGAVGGHIARQLEQNHPTPQPEGPSLNRSQVWCNNQNICTEGYKRLGLFSTWPPLKRGTQHNYDYRDWTKETFDWRGSHFENRFFCKLAPLCTDIHRYSLMFFLHTKMFVLFETSVFQACAASEGYRWDGVCRLHRHTARVFGCIFVLGCEDQWRWRATYPCWHCLQG